MEPNNMVFVYGTLRKGHSNNHMLKDAYCYGVGVSEDRYAMYIHKCYPYITSIDARYPIVGELYSVDDETLMELDKFEGHPRYYKRIEIPVNVEEKQYIAWAYFFDPPGVLMQSGDFNDLKNVNV
jgi:gamma-glutamylaminecyclotransferase